MNDEHTKLPDEHFKRDSEFDIPTVPGAYVVWDGLVERHGEPLVGIGREVLKVSDDIGDKRYQFEVAALFLEIQRERAHDGNGVGYVSGDMRRLREAMRQVADERTITRERVRQACTQSYDVNEKNMIEQFLDDLRELEARLEKWREQNSE